ncbi:MAG: hypothetical protein QXG18_02705 [Candidatus Pacearchaeota archaeon]
MEIKCPRCGRLRMVWGSRGIYSERDANAYAIRKVREYRKKQNNNIEKWEEGDEIWLKKK